MLISQTLHVFIYSFLFSDEIHASFKGTISQAVYLDQRILSSRTSGSRLRCANECYKNTFCNSVNFANGLCVLSQATLDGHNALLIGEGEVYGHSIHDWHHLEFDFTWT